MDKRSDDKKQKTPPSLKPDPDTLHKTDPQENMEGPVSSIMQNIKEEAEENDNETVEDAEKKKQKK